MTGGVMAKKKAQLSGITANIAGDQQIVALHSAWQKIHFVAIRTDKFHVDLLKNLKEKVKCDLRLYDNEKLIDMLIEAQIEIGFREALAGSTAEFARLELDGEKQKFEELLIINNTIRRYIRESSTTKRDAVTGAWTTTPEPEDSDLPPPNLLLQLRELVKQNIAMGKMANAHGKKQLAEIRANLASAAGEVGGRAKNVKYAALKKWALEKASTMKEGDKGISLKLFNELPSHFLNVSDDPQRLIYDALRARQKSK
jgi:hypothetical protein